MFEKLGVLFNFNSKIIEAQNLFRSPHDLENNDNALKMITWIIILMIPRYVLSYLIIIINYLLFLIVYYLKRD